jgi:hypothetical protein
MTNKTTPDDDWLDEILNTLELKIIPEEGYIAPKVHAEAKQAINAKITELLVEARIDEARLAEETTLDHVIPRSRAPELRYDPNNLRPCCWTCNSKKGSRVYEV